MKVCIQQLRFVLILLQNDIVYLCIVQALNFVIFRICYCKWYYFPRIDLYCDLVAQSIPNKVVIKLAFSSIIWSINMINFARRFVFNLVVFFLISLSSAYFQYVSKSHHLTPTPTLFKSSRTRAYCVLYVWWLAWLLNIAGPHLMVQPSQIDMTLILS